MPTVPLLEQGQLRDAKILLVDDHEDAVALLRQVLQKSGYANIYDTTDSRETVAMCEEIAPDLLVLDLNMPPPSGYDILDQLVLRPAKKSHFAILVLTADITPMAKLKALSLGAKDFLTKPFEQVDLLLRVRNLLETQHVYRQLESLRQSLNVEEARSRSSENRNEALERLYAAVECWNPRLAERAVRVGRLAGLLARSIGLSATEANQIESSARLYDIGRLAFAGQALDESSLPQDERARLRGHVTVAEKILGKTAGGLAGAKLPLEIATSHHERWDGGGYPRGLQGEEIPLSARIVAVADTFDLLLHPEGDKPDMPTEEAIAEVTRQAGFAFDPAITEALERTLLLLGCPTCH